MAETYHPRGELVDGYPVKDHPLYTVWASMKSRCNIPSQPGYENYGGRGIGYCDRWKHFANFAEDMFPTWREGLTIERVENNEDYSPDNCVWADRTSQCLNRRRFKTNSTGATGVVELSNGSYNARLDFRGRRVNLGNFTTFEGAVAARSRAYDDLMRGEEVKSAAGEKARSDSLLGIRGVSLRSDGYYVVRKNVKGKRLYLGCYHTLDDACAALNRFETNADR